MYKVLLLDDEYLALQLLQNFLQRQSDMQIVAALTTPLRAIELLKQEPIDILFLDIQMPFISGLTLLRELEHPPTVIFTTAYSEYAAQAFDLNAADYLVKPFAYQRFEQALLKARAQVKTPPPAPVPFLLVKSEGALCKIFVADILWVEGLREYVRIVCLDGKKYVVLEALKNLEQALPAADFVRIHKSYIVAKAQVKAANGNEVHIADQHLPISRDRKTAVMALLFGSK